MFAIVEEILLFGIKDVVVRFRILLEPHEEPRLFIDVDGLIKDTVLAAVDEPAPADSVRRPDHVDLAFNALAHASLRGGRLRRILVRVLHSHRHIAHKRGSAGHHFLARLAFIVAVRPGHQGGASV